MEPVLSVHGLIVDFGEVRAVDGFDLSVAAGTSLALIGRNGAGKSTTMRVLGGVLPPSAGVVRVAGQDAGKDPSAVRAAVGYCPDVGGLIPRATPWEHLQLAARLRGMDKGWEDRARDLLDRFELAGVADRITAGFSHGMGRRMSVVLAAFHEPRVLLLDEPFDGVDPLGVDATMQVVKEAQASGAAVLVSTHLLHLAVEACTEAVVLKGGRVVGAAPAAELVGDDGRERYRRPHLVSARTQVLALIRLRWTLVRSQGVRIALASVMGLVPVLGALVLLARQGAEPAALTAAVHAAPAAFLGFGALAIIAPLTAGGNELVPSDQLVAYPVRPGTLYLSSLVLAPVNLVWIVQLLVLIAETGFLTLGHGSLLRGLLLSCLYVLACTAVGQSVAWTMVGLRRTRRGRTSIRTALVLLAVAGVVIVRTGHGDAVVDDSFAPAVARAVKAPLAGWLPITAILVAVTVAAFTLGIRVCTWALRRPADAGANRSSKDVRRREAPASAYQSLLAVDRASVWRAPALRRGALVLAVMPGVAAAGVGVPWQSLVLLPGLVAAGGGLLFGFNAFCLDASGAVWLASLPHPPALVARAKARVTAEAVLLGALLAAVIGSIRAIGTPTLTELTAIFASALTCSLLVVALCLSSAVRRPHRADLNGARDSVAPPGAMVLTSTKLAVPAAALGAVLEAAAGSSTWWLPLAIAIPVAVGSSSWIAASLRSYDDPWLRSRIVQTVSAG